MTTKKRKLSKEAQEMADKACVRCGYSPEHHRLVNYADGPNIGVSDLVCPTALYKSLAEAAKDRVIGA